MGADHVYLRRLDRIDGLDVYRVDGHKIRDRIDVEFTNGHHHYSRRYVPPDEIWVDREAPGAGEWRFWAVRQAVERGRMAKGDSYLRALRVAARVERAERHLAIGLGRERPTHKEIQHTARRRQIGEVDGRAVWLVDGRVVRDLAYLDFTLGGHGYRYKFVPRREIWIDDAVRVSERAAILHHEVVELRHMARGMSYGDAHALASQAERRFRAQARRKSML